MKRKRHRHRHRVYQRGAYLLLLGLLFLSPQGFASPLNKDLESSGEYVRKSFLQKMKLSFSNEGENEGKKKALIIGDSHAQDFLNGVLENHFLSNYQISTRYIPTRCQIYLGNNYSRYLKAEDKQLCESSDNLFLARKQIGEADLIILAASWKKWAAEELPQTIKNLHLRPQQKLIVIGRKSFSKSLVDNYQQLPKEDLLQMRNRVDEHQDLINKIMSQSLSKDVFVNIHQIICGDALSCPVFTDKLKLISFDGGHFSKNGARYVTKLLFQGSQLGAL